MPTLLTIIASTRPERVGTQIADWFLEQARAHGGFELDVVDLAEYHLPFVDEPNHPSLRQYTKDHTKAWSARVDAADAFVFVMPEYNFGYTAPLKNAIDFLYEEWAYKPVGFVSYGGTAAGTRAVQMIKQIVTTLKMIPVADAVPIPLRQTLDENGKFQPTPILEGFAKDMLDESLRYVDAMAGIRGKAAV